MLIRSLPLAALCLIALAEASTAADPFDASCPQDIYRQSEPVEALLAECKAATDAADTEAAGLPEALYRLALLTQAHDFNDRESVLAVLDRVIAMSPEHKGARLKRAELRNTSVGLGNGTEDILFMMAVAPTDPDVAMAYARSLEATDNSIDALDVIERAVSANPNNPILLGRRAQLLVGFGKYDEAVKDAVRAAEATPEDPNALILKTELLLATGQTKAAADAVGSLKSMPLIPGTSSYVVARLAIAEGRWDDAAAELDRYWDTGAVWSVIGGFEAAALLRVGALARQGRVEEATEVMTGTGELMSFRRVLRLQVLFRNIGYEDVPINGTMDKSTLNRIFDCLGDPRCSSAIDRKA